MTGFVGSAAQEPASYSADSQARQRRLWRAIRDAVERVPSAHDADVMLAAILPLLPEFEKDTYGEEYHRCYCKRGYDHVSDL